MKTSLTFAAVIISDVLDSVSDHLLVVHDGFGGDLPAHHHHPGLGDGLAGHLSVRVLLEMGVKDRV